MCRTLVDEAVRSAVTQPQLANVPAASLPSDGSHDDGRGISPVIINLDGHGAASPDEAILPVELSVNTHDTTNDEDGKITTATQPDAPTTTPPLSSDPMATAEPVPMTDVSDSQPAPSDATQAVVESGIAEQQSLSSSLPNEEKDIPPHSETFPVVSGASSSSTQPEIVTGPTATHPDARGPDSTSVESDVAESSTPDTTIPQPSHVRVNPGPSKPTHVSLGPTDPAWWRTAKDANVGVGSASDSLLAPLTTAAPPALCAAVAFLEVVSATYHAADVKQCAVTLRFVCRACTFFIALTPRLTSQLSHLYHNFLTR